VLTLEYKNEKLIEFNNYLKGRKVAVIGLGVSNIPLISYLYNLKAEVTIFDNKEIDKIDNGLINQIIDYGMEFSFGKDYLKKLKGFDIIFRSPSCLPTVPELIEEAERGAIITSEIEMVLELSPSKIIGITGSDGKTTTTTLIAKVLEAGGYNVFLGGNIGYPLFTKIEEMTPDDFVVLELSSFQLMNMKTSPMISVITNITPNHLNIHSSMEEYIEAKQNIFKHQTSENLLILNYDNEITRACKDIAPGRVIYFSSKEKLENGYIVDDGKIKFCQNGLRSHILDTRNIILRGKHNSENICCVLAATKEFVNIETAVKTISEFRGVEHRIELVKETEDRIRWYNDSASSSPTRTIVGLNAFNLRNIILIAGGYDKSLDYKPLAKPIIENCKELILIGQTADKIENAVREELEHTELNKDLKIHRCDTLKQTVILANRLAKKGDVVLFSPASASFDMFKNFADRGNQFKELVEELIK
jgi:UDP-N-acetylmuramoylalanine--D-glutamate ligase